ncbi:glycosyltransferase family 2 protein [Hyphobacterium sp. CCMP332]|nr:glycosyltransferase family 2 protein [Hyphobacterium sp. CCMP332]
MNAKVSIITVNYRQTEVSCELLRSIKALSYKNVETILVDNGRILNSDQKFLNIIPDLKIFHSEKNLGFAGANNLAIKASEGDYILLLNNDTEVPSNLIEKLLKHFDEKIAAISPIIRYYKNPVSIQYAGFSKINSITGRNRMEVTFNTNLSSSETNYFHGAAVMLSKAAIQKAGLMPEEYFLYYEELAWSEKFKKRGFKIKVAHDVYILHKESMSTGKGSPLKRYYQNRNRLKFLMKHSSILKFSFFMMFYILISFPRQFLSQNISHKKAILWAVKDFFMGTFSFKVNT